MISFPERIIKACSKLCLRSYPAKDQQILHIQNEILDLRRTPNILMSRKENPKKETLMNSHHEIYDSEDGWSLDESAQSSMRIEHSSVEKEKLTLLLKNLIPILVCNLNTYLQE